MEDIIYEEIKCKGFLKNKTYYKSLSIQERYTILQKANQIIGNNNISNILDEEINAIMRYSGYIGKKVKEVVFTFVNEDTGNFICSIKLDKFNKLNKKTNQRYRKRYIDWESLGYKLKFIEACEEMN